MNVRSEFNVFGREKAKLIAGAKIVLNMHYYTNPSILETERLGLLLANKKCVVSESSSEVDRDQNYSQGVVFESDPNELVKRCQELLASYELRENVQQQGYDWFSAKMKLETKFEDLTELARYFN